MPKYVATCGYCFRDTILSNKKIEAGSTRIWACHRCRRLSDSDRYDQSKEREYQAAKFWG